VAILREQGVNSHVEMAYAFTEAGFEAFDVHMTDLQAGRARLADFQGVVACGGFSYGDTLGAGEGWARSITVQPEAGRGSSQAFFATARHLWPGRVQRLPDVCRAGRHHPRRAGLAALHRNQSEQFEARLSLVEVLEPPSLFFRHGRQPAADRRGARRGFCRLSHRGDARRCMRRDALRRPPRRSPPRPTRSTPTAAPAA
jgi:phosphoribosylformylglycinamidine synthase